jgi:hypothetical protein
MEEAMTATRTALSALIAAIAVAVVSVPASAQDAKRDAAIRKCVAAVQQITGTGEEEMSRRVAAWKACMSAEGERP